MPKIHEEQTIKILIKDSIQSCTCKTLPPLLLPNPGYVQHGTAEETCYV